MTPKHNTLLNAKSIAFALAALLLFVIHTHGATYELSSPNKKLNLRIDVGPKIEYDLLLNQTPLLENSTLVLDVEHRKLGIAPQVVSATPATVNRDFLVPVPLKSGRIREHYNELRLQFKDSYTVVFRLYNEGMAYRFETSLPQNTVRVYNEDATLSFAGNFHVFYPKEDGFFSHNEREFLYLPLKDIPAASLASIPVIVDANGRAKLMIADADVANYPGLWFRGNSNTTLSATFPGFPLTEELKGDRDFTVTKTADYIAETKGTRTFPWRIVGVAETDADLITNQLVYLLAQPSQVDDTSWIKPGKVAWDWYNANNIYGVDFKSGINTATYKYYIDFASKHGIEYIILDEGWYKLGNLLQVVPEMNIEELVAYGKQKNVGIILWVVWKTLDDQFGPAFDQFTRWGVKGLKVDFMQRDDQKLMDFYQRVCREAAKRKLLVDFHGGIRAATMTRTWPNLLTNEGVRGLEQTKWSKYANPEHNVTLPFTRMLVGPMDYTPGAMANSGAERNFAAVFERPMSLGTRCHQLAMYVVYESPLQMLADSPSHYLREPEIMNFLGPVPTVWHETLVLDAKMGDYVVIARRRNEDWYVGAMTDWTGRELQLSLTFLGGGRYELDQYKDGVNAERTGSDYQRVKSNVDNKTRLSIKLAPGGGWAARIRRL
ncbi:MAG TPA: glycoside hydrolase family 97 protein [Pyrinomonadaceae bacterium]|nr:glycoside hydrolase family 97 protein [Pyrinomonadaceae bacterium]